MTALSSTVFPYLYKNRYFQPAGHKLTKTVKNVSKIGVVYMSEHVDMLKNVQRFSDMITVHV